MSEAVGDSTHWKTVWVCWPRYIPRHRFQKEKACLLQPRPERDGLPHRASHDRPADVWIPHGKDMIPEAWDSAVTSSLRPATRNPRPTTTPTQNLAEYENLKRTLHDIANRCHRSGLRFTQCSSMVTQEAGETRHTTWSSGSLTDSPPPLSAHQSTPVSNWLSASLSCRDVFGWLPQETPPHPSVPTTGGQPGMTQALTPGQPTSTTTSPLR